MRKILRIIGVLILLILIALITVPYFYKEEIAIYLKEDINKNFNAQIDYEDLSLSLFKDFPNLNVSLKNISVDGIDRFQDVGLASVGRLNLSLNAKKVFIDKDLEINKIKIDDLNLNMLVLKNGEANYAILKENPADSINTEKESFELKIKEYKITNSNINYENQENGMTFYLNDFNHYGSGKINEETYVLNTTTEAEKMDLFYGIHYINEAKIDLKSNILIEEDNSKFTFENSNLLINDLEIEFAESFVFMKDESIEMDIVFQTKEEALKQMLSLVPTAYISGLENVEANGKASLKGFVKGTYHDTSYPSFKIDANLSDASLKHPNLTETISGINMVSMVDFKGGKNLDNTIINIPKIQFSIADNFVDGQLFVSNPTSDPFIRTAFKSNLDLKKLSNAVEITSVEDLEGFLDADFKLDGRLSAIEKKQYDHFKASGFLNLKDVIIKSTGLPHIVKLPKANMSLSPQALLIDNVKSFIGENDFALQGNISNYISYLLNKNEVLHANLTLHSNSINLNDFLSEEKAENEEDETLNVIKIPTNIDATFSAEATNLKYKDLDLKDVNGTLRIKDGKAVFDAVLLKTLDGAMTLNGNYDSTTETPSSNIDVAIQKMSITKSVNSFSAFQAFAPILHKVQGDFFSDIHLDLALDGQMNPILTSLKAQGNFNTDAIQLQGIDVIENIGKMLKISALENPAIDVIKANFDIENGTMSIKPFNFKLNDMEAGLQGKVNLDKQVDFVLQVAVPRDKLGTNPNAILEGLVGKLSNLGLDTDLGEIINMNFKITGDYNKPKIFPSIAGYEGASAKEIIKEVIEDKVEEVVTDVVDKGREEAQKQADKIMRQAQVQADSLISKATKLGITIRKEAKVQGDNLIAKAKNPFEKIGAKAAAKTLDKEADKKANKLVVKAREKADLLLLKAQEESDKLLQIGEE